MLEAGNILHGYFNLGPNGWKNKFVIILHCDGNECILMTFTTSQLRSSIPNPVHGRNPQTGPPISYVFKAGIEIGLDPSNNKPFSFRKDTTVVGDYGIYNANIDLFCKSVSSLKVVCKLHKHEYDSLIYTLYKCPKLKAKHKAILENILMNL